MEIPFTRFVPPRGLQISVSHTTDSQELFDKAMAVIKAGGRFTVERLRTGHTSFCCEAKAHDAVDDDDIMDVACEISYSPDEQAAVEKVVQNAYNYVVLRLVSLDFDNA